MRKHSLLKHGLAIVGAAVLLFNQTLTAQMVVVEPVVEAERPKVGYEKGFFLAYGDNYLLRMNSRLHTLAQYFHHDARHVTSLTVPNARLIFGGHVFDPRVGFTSHLAFDNASFKLAEFFGNFGLVPGHANLKVGYLLGNYSLLESYSSGKLALIDRASAFGDWKIGNTTGLSLYANKKNPFSYELSVFENGLSAKSQKRLGGVSANVAYNHNEIDPSDEVDFQGGPFRAMLSLGGFTRAQIETWKLVGYAGAFETLMKFYGTTFSAGLFSGVPEANATTQDNTIVQSLTKNQIRLGGYSQLGYLFDAKFGIAARYAMLGNYEKAPERHEILGSASVYFLEHNLKVQLDGGTILRNRDITPQVRAQLQLAF